MPRTYTARPYRKGFEPSDCVRVLFVFRVDLCTLWGNWYRVDVYSVGADGSRTLRLRGFPYRPGQSARATRAWCDDVVGFARAFVDRPEEFDREPTDIEQINRDWWTRHGDALESAVYCDR